MIETNNTYLNAVWLNQNDHVKVDIGGEGEVVLVALLLL